MHIAIHFDVSNIICTLDNTTTLLNRQNITIHVRSSLSVQTESTTVREFYPVVSDQPLFSLDEAQDSAFDAGIFSS